ncbi:MAG: triosephosphate isomerase [Bacteroidales bacterium]|nr:triosephosphate isomerase [Bacteroidales bacterium]
MARRPIIAGNWKMNNTIAEGVKLVKELAPLVADVEAVDVVACPTATALAAVADACKGTKIHVGAQNVHWEPKGAFTGEISTGMLKEIGVEYVVLGHSERRDYFGETDEGVNKRARAAYAAGITPIICCGESLEIREAVAEVFGQSAADAIRIQYGGSVKPATIKDLMAQPNVDGALVGGASLKAADFSAIVKF